MHGRLNKLLAGGATVAALALGGAAIARATGTFDDGDRQLTGPDADRAIAAALQATGGGTVNAVERDSENGATYEVEVRRKDGSTVDVDLDESFGLVAIEGDSETEDAAGEDDGDRGERARDDDDADTLVGRPEAEQARAAAVRAVGGGTATAVERDSDNAYEVEVTREDGSRVDVDLGESFNVVPDGDSD